MRRSGLVHCYPYLSRYRVPFMVSRFNSAPPDSESASRPTLAHPLIPQGGRPHGFTSSMKISPVFLSTSTAPLSTVFLSTSAAPKNLGTSRVRAATLRTLRSHGRRIFLRREEEWWSTGKHGSGNLHGPSPSHSRVHLPCTEILRRRDGYLELMTVLNL